MKVTVFFFIKEVHKHYISTLVSNLHKNYNKTRKLSITEKVLSNYLDTNFLNNMAPNEHKCFRCNSLMKC